ncbi:fumarylacetoacetate hydrolase family protein [Amycolatopsis sp. A133]|uniref:2-keto-4-pentenoate hydratase n=1 Tax=Amycolatopsis sp. A133 TaxID=3064472 RepID=UPI0027EF2F4A|nr:fumarylacetoacetate hydrolase family protein [Amycolatopsis sp. A133]MDQ7807505.1 fumarylacetoacetate hydrolase family protein [Amycolatopsis sp. A133]
MTAETVARTRAKALYTARATRTAIAPFTDEDPELGLREGYEIQQELLTLLLADGDRAVGYKAGLTSKPMQAVLGVGTPDYGPVLASTIHPDGARVDLGEFIAPRVEAEIVFRLAAPLRGPGVTAEQARAALGEVIAGLEIVDSRIADWRIRLADTVADLASNGAVVLADPVPAGPGDDYRLLGMAFSRNGELVATGAGAAALGDPVAVVAWLANTLGEHGVTLDAGQLVMTGALHAAVPLAPGDRFVAEFDRLGTVRLDVAAGAGKP